MRKPGFTLEVMMPCWITSVGRRACARATRFCVCTAAMSALVPGSNVSVIDMPPLELDDELKYSR